MRTVLGAAVDPISVGLLVALAGGAGGELGRQVWAGLSALVGRPFRREASVVGEPALGGAELTALEEAPEDEERARALSAALAARAEVDTEFAAALEEWNRRAAQVQVRTGRGSVSNSISGGTQHGPVIQGRDFSGGITFNSPAPAPPPEPDHTDPSEG
ncbi:MAG: hypothetical protein QOF98_3228 [Streptomyces sp.]|nr:hypothetical protein [Streptomyces sp.]